MNPAVASGLETAHATLELGHRGLRAGGPADRACSCTDTLTGTQSQTRTRLHTRHTWALTQAVQLCTCSHVDTRTHSLLLRLRGGVGRCPRQRSPRRPFQKPEPAASLRSCPCRLAWAPLPPPEAALAPPPPAAAGPAVLVVVLFGLLLS